MSVFHYFSKIFLVLSPFLLDLDPDPYCFCLDPDPYQISPWIRIRIRNEFFRILDPDPDPFQNDTDPPHCSAIQERPRGYIFVELLQHIFMNLWSIILSSYSIYTCCKQRQEHINSESVSVELRIVLLSEALKYTDIESY